MNRTLSMLQCCEPVQCTRTHTVNQPNKSKQILTAIDIQFSSAEFGNLTITLDPAFSSLSFSGRKRHTTLMLSSAAISRSADIFNYHTLGTVVESYCLLSLFFFFYSLAFCFFHLFFSLLCCSWMIFGVGVFFLFCCFFFRSRSCKM